MSAHDSIFSAAWPQTDCGPGQPRNAVFLLCWHATEPKGCERVLVRDERQLWASNTGAKPPHKNRACGVVRVPNRKAACLEFYDRSRGIPGGGGTPGAAPTFGLATRHRHRRAREPAARRRREVKTPLDIYLQRHSPLSPDLWLYYSRLSARYISRHVPGADISLYPVSFCLSKWIKPGAK